MKCSQKEERNGKCVQEEHKEFRERKEMNSMERMKIKKNE
jgi:hypothetical protein